MGERKKTDCHSGEWVTGVAMAGGIIGAGGAASAARLLDTRLSFNGAATQGDLVLIEDYGLTGGDSALGRVEGHPDAAVGKRGHGGGCLGLAITGLAVTRRGAAGGSPLIQFTRFAVRSEVKRS